MPTGERNVPEEGEPSSEGPFDHEHEPALTRLRWLSELFDDRFRLPGTNKRFGLDGILGLVPGIGDATTTIVSVYLAAEGWRLGMPKMTMLRMAFNIITDMVLGAIPLIGDLFDFAWRANRKNTQLVLDHVEQGRNQPTDPS